MKRNGIIALVLFMALLFVTVMDMVLNLRLNTEAFTLEQLIQVLAIIGLLSVGSKILTISLFGVLVFELGLFRD